MARCLNCGIEIEGRGRTCSARCRVAWSRKCNTVTGESVTPASVTPGPVTPAIEGWAGHDCQCRHCRANRTNGGKHAINHGPARPAWALGQGELNRQALPGDPDYTGCALVRTSEGC